MVGVLEGVGDYGDSNWGPSHRTRCSGNWWRDMGYQDCSHVPSTPTRDACCQRTSGRSVSMMTGEGERCGWWRFWR